MKVVHLVPGSGGTFYCQNCVRDSALVRALRRQGHDVMMVPLYLPLLTEGQAISEGVPVFFGGVNVYLQQQFGLFRKTPRWLDRLFDASWILRRAAAREGSTNAAALGPMTLSMLQGRGGNQRKEIDRLVAWLAGQERPDLIHVSNALLLGMACEVKQALAVPLVCSLQDEDTWLDAMREPDRDACWGALSELARDVDAFVAVSHWYAGRMRERLGIQDDRVTVVYVGIDLDDAPPAIPPFDPPVVGFLSRMGESQGLGVLVDAFLRLKQKPELSGLRLHATGGLTPADRPFVEQQRQKLAEHGAEADTDFTHDFDRQQRHEFLRSLSVLSVPAPAGEAFGIFVLEALASGVPVVQPNVGAFPELLDATGGGILYDAKDEHGLVDALEGLLLDPDRARELGKRGHAAVQRDFGIDRMAREVLGVYTSLAGERRT